VLRSHTALDILYPNIVAVVRLVEVAGDFSADAFGYKLVDFVGIRQLFVAGHNPFLQSSESQSIFVHEHNYSQHITIKIKY